MTTFRNEKKYIVFWTIWGILSLLAVRWTITDPIVQALKTTNHCEAK